MGYWGYKATESDSALDYMTWVAEGLEKLWNESTDHGDRMAVIYVLTQAPEIDGTDHRGLKKKASTYLYTYSEMINDRNLYGERQEEIDYLRGLREKLQETQGTTLFENLASQMR